MYSNAYIRNLKKWYWRIFFAGQQWRNRHREQTYGHGERGGEGEIHGESNMETYITICKIDSQWEFAVWLRKLKQGLWINLEGWDGEGDGREVKEWGDICMLLLLLSHFSRVWLCVTPWTAAHQAPPSLGSSRQEHWSGLPFPSPMHESRKWKWSRSVMSDS